jgi:hypothetical protein
MKEMNRKTIIVSIIFIVLLAGIPESLASPQYLTNLTGVYGDGSCNTCHVMQQGGGQRNFNGTMPTNGTFERRNRTSSPNYNETSAGRNSNRTFTNRTSNRTLPLNSYGTLFGNQTNHVTDPSSALMAIGQPPVATTTPNEPMGTATGTKGAPGFDLVVFIFGSFAGILLARRHKK